jgi:hypothetical protein
VLGSILVLKYWESLLDKDNKDILFACCYVLIDILAGVLIISIVFKESL